MKFNRHTYILLSAVFCFMLTACSDEIMNLAEGEVGEFTSPADDDGMVDVTFKLSIDPSMIAKTRAVGEETTDGAESTEEVELDLTPYDLLIYVIRDENNNILYQYGKGYVDETLANEPACQNNYSIQPDNNQTLMRATWQNGKEELTLRVMRNTVFKFSCWVQSSQSKAYDFNYLTALKVNYSEMSNSKINDAFCATSIFSIGLRDATVSITLKRPFAQINVGIDEEVFNNKKGISFGAGSGEYKYSKMKLNGVATAFDVVKNKVWTQRNFELYSLYKENKADKAAGKTKEEYGKRDILADSLYANYSEHLFDKEETVEGSDEETGEGSDKVISDFQVTSNIELPYSLMPGLKIDANTFSGNLEELEVFDYSTWKKKSFRQLAMAYVLVQDFENNETDEFTDEDEDETDNENNETDKSTDEDETDKSNTIGLVSFCVAKENYDDKGNLLTDDEGNIVLSEIKYEPKEPKNEDNTEEEPLRISVKRNWRTNLLFTGWDWLDNTTNTTPTTLGNQ